jgi:hypothetical protein
MNGGCSIKTRDWTCVKPRVGIEAGSHSVKKVSLAVHNVVLSDGSKYVRNRRQERLGAYHCLVLKHQRPCIQTSEVHRARILECQMRAPNRDSYCKKRDMDLHCQTKHNTPSTLETEA